MVLMINGRKMTEEEKNRLFSKRKKKTIRVKDPGGRVTQYMTRRRSIERGLPPMMSTEEADPMRTARFNPRRKPDYSGINELVDRGVIPGKAPEPSAKNVVRGIKREFTNIAQRAKAGVLTHREANDFIERYGEPAARLLAGLASFGYISRSGPITKPVK